MISNDTTKTATVTIAMKYLEAQPGEYGLVYSQNISLLPVLLGYKNVAFGERILMLRSKDEAYHYIFKWAPHLGKNGMLEYMTMFTCKIYDYDIGPTDILFCGFNDDKLFAYITFLDNDNKMSYILLNDSSYTYFSTESVIITAPGYTNLNIYKYNPEQIKRTLFLVETFKNISECTYVSPRGNYLICGQTLYQFTMNSLIHIHDLPVAVRAISLTEDGLYLYGPGSMIGGWKLWEYNLNDFKLTQVNEKGFGVGLKGSHFFTYDYEDEFEFYYIWKLIGNAKLKFISKIPVYSLASDVFLESSVDMSYSGDVLISTNDKCVLVYKLRGA